MQFAQIPGLHELKNQLITSFRRGKVAHAQLFSGSPGIATFPIAIAYATYLMCENKKENDSCGTCVNCARIRKSIHPDVHWYFPKVSASDAGKYDKVLAEALPLWRTFIDQSPYGSFDDWAVKYGQENKNLQLSREDSRQILKTVSMRAVEGGYKIIFIWGVEYMHPTGANAILKTLEEPPEKTIYLLISFNYEALLQTITSRSQLINVPPHQDQDIQQYLTETLNTPSEQAAQLAKVAQGKMQVALQQLQNDEDVAYGQFREWMLACWGRDLTFLVNASEAFSKMGKTHQRSFLLFSLSLIANAVRKAAGGVTNIIHEQEDQFVTKYAQQLGLERLQGMYELLNEALQHLERNSNPRVTHLNLSLAILQKING